MYDGSENAPEDSGYISEGVDENRILNESSLMYEEEDMIMTARSESVVDEEEGEVHDISHCKAINSSYINLKRNNILLSYVPKK